MNGASRLAAWSVFAAGLLLAGAALADPPTRVGRLSYLSGAVSLAPAGLGEWSEAVINRPVTSGDQLWTDSGARAEVHVGSTAWRLDALTSVDVANLDDNITQLHVAQGTLQVRVRQVSGDFEIDTPAAAVELLGVGSYRVDVDASGTRTTLTVRSGQATIAGTSTKLTLADGQSATLYSDSPTYDATRASRPDGFDAFCRGRDEREDRVAAARYVPPGMTGYEDLDAYGSWATEPDYGTVWYPASVDADWAPYREGRWLWVAPWGWTWIDEAPWGFAPFHYGRWIHVHGRWGWAPGDVHVRPVYAPALVAFVGGSAALGPRGVVGWFPLGFGEAYIPWYSVSRTYVREINRGHSERIGERIAYANRNVPSALTAVPGSAFAHAQAVRGARLRSFDLRQLAQAPVVTGGAPVQPTRDSLRVKPVNIQPPERTLARPIFELHAAPSARQGLSRAPAPLAPAPGAPTPRGPIAKEAPALPPVLPNAAVAAPDRRPGFRRPEAARGNQGLEPRRPNARPGSPTPATISPAPAIQAPASTITQSARPAGSEEHRPSMRALPLPQERAAESQRPEQARIERARPAREPVREPSAASAQPLAPPARFEPRPSASAPQQPRPEERVRPLAQPLPQPVSRPLPQALVAPRPQERPRPVSPPTTVAPPPQPRPAVPAPVAHEPRPEPKPPARPPETR